MTLEKILLLEDENTLGKNLKMVLASEGYDVDWYTTGDEAVAAALEFEYDMMILDVMLKSPADKPVSHVDNGLEVARVITQQKPIPYMLLTSRDEPIDILQGLNMGADDYVTKPYDLTILLARIRAILRRCKSSRPATTIIECNGLKLNLMTHKVTVNDKPAELTNQLFEILYLLLQNKGRIVTKEELYKNV